MRNFPELIKSESSFGYNQVGRAIAFLAKAREQRNDVTFAKASGL